MRRIAKSPVEAIPIVLLVVSMAAWGVAEAADSCLLARVPQSFVLPDGSVHEPGTLRVCRDRALNPAIELDEITIGGNKVGVFQAKHTATEARDVFRPVFYFASNGEEWKLLGLATPAAENGGAVRSIVFMDAREGGPTIRTEWSPKRACAEDAPGMGDSPAGNAVLITLAATP